MEKFLEALDAFEIARCEEEEANIVEDFSYAEWNALKVITSSKREALINLVKGML